MSRAPLMCDHDKSVRNLFMTEGVFDIGRLHSTWRQEAVIDFERIFADDMQTILGQQEIDVVDRPSTRILDRQQCQIDCIVLHEGLRHIITLE